MRHTPVNAQLRDIWNWMYGGVNRTNFIMEFQDKTDFDGKNEILGQARFLRAYYYFELVKWFGDVPMPIDKRVSFGEETSFDRTPKAQVYAQIETQAGRVTKGAAQALLGKVYLFQEKFSEAATVLDQVIAGPYDLLQDYSTMFENDNENNIESVFEVQYTDSRF